MNNLSIAQSAAQNDMIKIGIRKEAIDLAIKSFNVTGAPVQDDQLMRRAKKFHDFMTS